jgi:hypothetical protein
MIIKKVDSESDSDYTYETITETETQVGGKQWMGLNDDPNYKRPKKTKQDLFTKEEILKNLEGYERIKYVTQFDDLKPFRTWVKYINTPTKKFRKGGLFVKLGWVEKVPTYITLYNSRLNLTWSVQLKSNAIYVQKGLLNQPHQKSQEPGPDERVASLTKRSGLNPSVRARTQTTQTERVSPVETATSSRTRALTETESNNSNSNQKSKENFIKDKLFSLYLDGRLKITEKFSKK